jgi:hypothetical protein
LNTNRDGRNVNAAAAEMSKRTLVTAAFLASLLVAGVARASAASGPILYLRIEGIAGEVDLSPTPRLLRDCTSYCAYQFPSSTIRIELTAHSFNGRFVGWTSFDSRYPSPCSGTSLVCSFAPRQTAMSLRALFSPVMVIVHAVDGGSVAIDGRSCGSNCGVFDSGSVAHLSATADPGYRFDGWTSMCNNNPCSYTVRTNHETTALFTNCGGGTCSLGSPITTAITVHVQVRGPGHIVGSGGLSCLSGQPNCHAVFDLGTQVTLRGVSDGGKLLSWRSNIASCHALSCQLPAVKSVNGSDPTVSVTFG